MSEKKVRAKCNRTLTVSESEIPQLEQFILSANGIKNKFIDDCVINADLFECLDYIPDEYFNLIKMFTLNICIHLCCTPKPPFRACPCQVSGGLGGSLCHHFPQFYRHSIS